MTTTATYNDPWAGPVAVTWTPMRHDKARGFWKRDDGQTVGGQVRAFTQAKAVSYAKWHASFSNVLAGA